MAIHSQEYTRYEGTLDESRAWWVIARVTFRTHLRFVRTILTLLFLSLAPLIAAGLIFAEYALQPTLANMTQQELPPDGAYVAEFLRIQFFSLAILFMASGCGVIAEDLRHRTFQLYFSKPLTRLDYGVGKFLGLFMLGSLVTVVPALLLCGLRVALHSQTPFLKIVSEQSVMAVGLSTFITAIAVAMVVGLSSLTPRAGYVVLSWIGVILVPWILQGIVAATDASATAALWSLPGNFHVLANWLLTDVPFEGPVWVAPTILVAAGALGLGAMARRISRLEGVA